MDKYDIIKGILGDNVREELKEYYYYDKKIYCCDINLKSMYENVEVYDFLKPINHLANYYKDTNSDYYSQLGRKYENYTFTTPLYIQEFSNNYYDLDEIALEYVKCFSNLSLLLIWPIANITSNDDLQKSDFYSHLSKNGTIHIIKELTLTRKQIQGAIYQIYYDKSGFKDINSIKGKQQKGKADNQQNKIFLIYYQANNFDDISGKDAPLKLELRNILKKNTSEADNIKLNFFLHITDNHTQLVELTQLFCNKNSLRLLQYQRLDRVLNKSMDKSHIMFMTFKKWLYQNIEPIDHIRFMNFSSIVLYSLGLREMNDLDLIIMDKPQPATTNNFFEKIYFFFEDPLTNFKFIELQMKGHGEWFEGGKKEYMIQWFEKDWPELFGARSLDDAIINPKFHYYYFGIKIISMIADIKRRIKRSRAAAYTDLIAICKFTNQKIDIPKIPEGYWQNQTYTVYNEKEISILIKKIIWYLRSRYSLNLSADEIRSYLKIID